MTLRLLLDSNKPNLLVATIDCLHALLCDESTVLALKLIDSRFESPGIFPLSSKSSAKLFHDEFEAEEGRDSEHSLSDADVFREDIIVGFIFTETLPRLRYIIDKMNLPMEPAKILAILIRFSVHSVEACSHLVEVFHLLSGSFSAPYPSHTHSLSSFDIAIPSFHSSHHLRFHFIYRRFITFYSFLI